MKFVEKNPSRIFEVGTKSTKIHHMADITLDPGEQVTFLGDNNSEYDFVRKSWGYYASPSINGRLKSFNIRSFLVKNKTGQIYLMCVESNKMTDFEEYCSENNQSLVMELSDYLVRD